MHSSESLKAKSSSGIVAWTEQATGWQRKPKLHKPQVLSVEGAVGNEATAGTWVFGQSLTDGGKHQHWLKITIWGLDFGCGYVKWDSAAWFGSAQVPQSVAPVVLCCSGQA